MHYPKWRLVRFYSAPWRFAPQVYADNQINLSPTNELLKATDKNINPPPAMQFAVSLPAVFVAGSSRQLEQLVKCNCLIYAE
jgi:hypothetical protein